MEKKIKLALRLFLLLVMVQNLNAKEIQKEASDFYVSPSGSDSNSGTKEYPFATLTKPRDKVCEWNKNSNGESISEWLSGGNYILSETLIFGLDDSAKPGQTITYTALPNETPVICSDVPFTGWKKLIKLPNGLPKVAKGKIWVAKVPGQATNLKVLFSSKGLLPRARTKAISHQRTLDTWIGSEDFHTSLPFKQGTTGRLFNPAGSEIVVIPVAPWTINILPVNQSYFDFNRKYYKRINNIESETTVTLAIGELMDNKIIAKSSMQNRFYINPKYIYNGSRIKQYPDKIDLGNRKPFYPKNK